MTVGMDMPWTKLIAPELVSIADGSLCLKQTPKDLHLNHNGDMHAAVLFSMVEMAGMGVVVILLGDLASSSFVVVKNVNINFIARAQGEISFIANLSDEQQQQILSNAEAGDKVEQVVWVEAKDDSGNTVSTASVTAVICPQ